MKTVRCLVASLLVAVCCLSSPAWSTSVTTDQSDLWWNPTESGWGIQFVQRGSVIFATMFVYDQTKTPFWYSATLVKQAGAFTWSGDLIATTGPYFGTMPFNPSTVTIAKVGTMTWAAQTVETGVLTYNVGSVNVAKNLSRQPIATDDFSGHYGGGLHQTATGCSNSGFNGTRESIGTLNVTQNSNAITLQSFPSTGGSCSYSGSLSQLGQMGAVSGSFSCTDGSAGTIELFEMQVNITGLTGRFTFTNSNPAGCQVTGWFGGLRVTTF
jgi:hypothetical protein